MAIRTYIRALTKLGKSLYLLVLLTSLCYSSSVYAHPWEMITDGVKDGAHQQITIELSRVKDLKKVSKFTKMLAESQYLQDLRLEKVMLEADNAERSCVQWSATLKSDSLDKLEEELVQKAYDAGKLELSHDRSHRGFISFKIIAQSDNPVKETTAAENSKMSRYREIKPGLGFD